MEYVIHIYTADKFKAGTDAPVYLRFYDKNDKLVLSQTEIDPPGNPFEQNAWVIRYFYKLRFVKSFI